MHNDREMTVESKKLTRALIVGKYGRVHFAVSYAYIRSIQELLFFGLLKYAKDVPIPKDVVSNK